IIFDAGRNQLLEVLAGEPVTVQVPTAISVVASSATADYGQGVTLTATVTVPAGDPAPTAADGTVTFYDGAAQLGTAPLSGSSATATLPNVMLSPGRHTITAGYSGDSNFAAIPLGQVVVPASGLNFPGSVAVDSAGNVYIADTNNNRVVELLNNGTERDV